MKFPVVTCLGIGLLVYSMALSSLMASTEGGFPTDLELYNVYQMSGQKKLSKKDPKRIIEETQIMFIKNFFLNPFFNSSSEIRGDEEEDSNMVLSKQQNEVYNEMLSTEVARQLARQDILKMRKMLQKYVDREIAAEETRIN